MAVPALLTTTSGMQVVSGATGTTFVPSKPVSLAVGDLLVGVFYTDATGAVTMPSGFTNLHNVNPGGSLHLRVDWKIADSGDVAASTFTWSWTGTVYRVGCLLRVTGTATSGTPIENQASAGNTTSVASTNSSLPSVALTAAATVDDLGLLATAVTNDNSPTWSAQAGWTLQWNSADDVGLVKINLTSGTAAPATSHATISDSNAVAGPGASAAWAAMSPPVGGQDTPELYGRPYGLSGQRQMQQILAQ